MPDNSTLTDRATIIAAGLYANPNMVEMGDLVDPSGIATHAVRIAHAVRRAARENPNAFKEEDLDE